MRFERYDKLFEEAGRDREKFEQLLQRCQKQRRLGIAALKAVVVICLLLAAGVLYQAWQMLYPFWHAVRAGQLPPSPVLPAWLKAIVTPGMGVVWVIAGMSIYCWVFQLITAAHFANERVKTLLLIRGLRDAMAPQAEPPVRGQ
ncbi:hypothetical protein [Chthoniobacter flavus]|nr:hypothetical protein [Chthoniobacter flavus]